MILLVLFLGAIWGSLVFAVFTVLYFRFEPEVRRVIAENLPVLVPGEKGYIAGLSDEEQSFRDALPIDKEVKIL